MLRCTAVAQMLVAKGSATMPMLAKDAGVDQVISVATYLTVWCGSPSTNDQINIIRTRDTVNLMDPVFTWASQCENWQASTAIRHGAQDRGSRH